MTAEQDKPGSRLARWSRQKAESRKAEARQAEPVKETPAPEAAPAPLIDPATLPNIETLTETSDFTVFLQAGVPEGLRQEALRKLWRIEPSVVNYKALVEYNWDFNAPGYGALLPTDDVAKMLRQVLSGAIPRDDETLPPEQGAEETARETAQAPETEPPPLPSPEHESDRPLAEISEAPVPDPAGVSRPEEVSEAEARPRRRHGGALPS